MDKVFIEWSDTYNTGITKIDIQHKVIIKILNELYSIVIIDNNKYKIDDILNELVQYTIYHFGEEEKLFEKYNYTDEKEHKAEHKIFIDKINKIIKDKNKYTDSSILDLIEFLKDWLTEHILVTDNKYSVFFKNKGIIIKN